MTGRSHAGSCLITVQGSPLPDDVVMLLNTAWVDDNLHLPDLFVLRFRDPDRVVLTKAGITIGATVTVSVDTADTAPPQTLIEGEVTGLEVELDAEGTFTVVRGYDQSHRLRQGSRVAGYPNTSYDAIVRKVAQRAGLQPGQITPTKTTHPLVQQGNLDDWTFLHRLAAEVGYRITVEAGKLSFGPPPTSASAPAAKGGPGAGPFVLEPGTDLLALRAVVSAAEQVDKVEVRSWNEHDKKPVSGAAPAATTSAQVSPTPKALAGTFGRTPFISTHVPYQQQAEVTAAAKAIAEEIAGSFAELEGVVRGDPQLSAGRAVAVANLGEPFDGKYTLTRARHVFDPEQGYTTAISVTGAADRSLLGLVAGNGTGSAGVGVSGVAVGIVTDVADPEKLGRVRLALPWLAGDFLTDWAPTVQLGAGADRGTLLLPEVDDQVLVGFEQGDLRRPYVLGGLHSSVDKPPATPAAVDSGSGKVSRRALVTRTGHKLEFLESDSTAAKGITMATGDGKLTLQFDQQATEIAVTSGGTVVIDAANGVTINSSAGNLDLSGQKITLDAKTAVEVKGTTGVTVSTNGDLSLSGTSASLQGNANAEVKGGAMTTITGALVKIN
ncbi:MAG: VgrG-related protein [Pseudonocardiaceae bacterium]|nr:VgrG-related protein [Pseudonocardiaceae bacterium]